jgi:hypothetical protein
MSPYCTRAGFHHIEDATVLNRSFAQNRITCAMFSFISSLTPYPSDMSPSEVGECTAGFSRPHPVAFSMNFERSESLRRQRVAGAALHTVRFILERIFRLRGRSECQLYSPASVRLACHHTRRINYFFLCNALSVRKITAGIIGETRDT